MFSGMVPFQKAYLMICMTILSRKGFWLSEDVLVAMMFTILAGNHAMVGRRSYVHETSWLTLCS